MNNDHESLGGLDKPRLGPVKAASKAAQLRPFMPEIEQRLEAGERYQQIVDALNKAGIEINLKTFKNYLYRYRKSRKHKGGENPRATSAPGAADRATEENAPPSPEADGNQPEREQRQEVAESESESEEQTLDDILDARRRDRDDTTDQYLSQTRPLSLTRSKRK